MDVDESLELALKRSIYLASYHEFFKFCFRLLKPNERYEDAFHIKELCDLLQAEAERVKNRIEKTKDIIINVPPRSSKSLIVSVCFQAWVWASNPSATFICVSFDEDLSYLNAQYAKDIIKSDEYQQLFGDVFQIRSDADSKGFFQNDKGGYRLSKTTGGNITGFGAMFILVDDPQNPKNSESKVHRLASTDYYSKSLYNRLTPIELGVRIIVMQRLHEEDLTGWILSRTPDEYHHICLPAEEQDNIKPSRLKALYKEGLLDPIRLSRKILIALKNTLGSRGYSGQYDQRPSPDVGGIIKKEWFDIVSPSNVSRDIKLHPIHFVLDTAYTDKTENDPTAILTCFEKDGTLYILDAIEVWLEFPELCKFIVEHTKKFRLDSSSKLFIEPKASGKSVAAYLRSTTHLNIIEMKAPDASKITRAYAVTPKIESRRVRLVEGPYVEGFLAQCAAFPNALHDDMVDDLVHAINELLPANDGPDYMFL